MDLKKFLSGKDKNKKYKLNITNKYIKDSIQTLKDIKKTEYILLNYHKFNLELDEYFAGFLKEKNEFIQSFKEFLLNSKKDPNVSQDRITVYKEILSIIKSNLDNLITNFKILKQNIYKKSKQQERFNEEKFKFFSEKEKEPTDNNNIENNRNLKAKIKNKIKEILPFDLDKFEETIKNKYKEESHVIEMLMDKEKQNFEKTKKILFDLSSLMTNVQQKLQEQGEMTKNILFNSFQSVGNIEQGNKHLTKAKEYQKGRGLTIGLIFIILGLYLILTD